MWRGLWTYLYSNRIAPEAIRYGIRKVLPPIKYRGESEGGSDRQNTTTPYLCIQRREEIQTMIMVVETIPHIKLDKTIPMRKTQYKSTYLNGK